MAFLSKLLFAGGAYFLDKISNVFSPPRSSFRPQFHWLRKSSILASLPPCTLADGNDFENLGKTKKANDGEFFFHRYPYKGKIVYQVKHGRYFDGLDGIIYLRKFDSCDASFSGIFPKGIEIVSPAAHHTMSLL